MFFSDEDFLTGLDSYAAYWHAADPCMVLDTHLNLLCYVSYVLFFYVLFLYSFYQIGLRQSTRNSADCSADSCAMLPFQSPAPARFLKDVLRAHT